METQSTICSGSKVSGLIKPIGLDPIFADQPHVYRDVQVAEYLFTTYLGIPEPKIMIDTTKKEVAKMLSGLED